MGSAKKSQIGKSGSKKLLMQKTRKALFEVFVSLTGSSSPSEALDRLSDAHQRFAGFYTIHKPRQRIRARNTFNYLLRNEYIAFEQRGGGIVLRLTPRGRTRQEARALSRAFTLSNKRTPERWDGTWRLILFDIPAHERAKRNAFRIFICRLGAVMLQKSVWIYTHNCDEEITLLREFFGLSDYQLRLVAAQDVGDDRALRKHFKLPPPSHRI